MAGTEGTAGTEGIVFSTFFTGLETEGIDTGIEEETLTDDSTGVSSSEVSKSDLEILLYTELSKPERSSSDSWVIFELIILDVDEALLEEEGGEEEVVESSTTASDVIDSVEGLGSDLTKGFDKREEREVYTGRPLK